MTPDLLVELTLKELLRMIHVAVAVRMPNSPLERLPKASKPFKRSLANLDKFGVSLALVLFCLFPQQHIDYQVHSGLVFSEVLEKWAVLVNVGCIGLAVYQNKMMLIYGDYYRMPWRKLVYSKVLQNKVPSFVCALFNVKKSHTSCLNIFMYVHNLKSLCIAARNA